MTTPEERALQDQLADQQVVIDELNERLNAMYADIQQREERQWMLGKLAAYERVIEAAIEAATADGEQPIRVTPNYHTGCL